MRSIDPHFHIWDYANGVYPWLQNAGGEPDEHAPAQVRLQALRRDYLVADYLRDVAGHDVVKGVHVEAKYDENDPVAETRWLQTVADDPASRGFPHAIVAFADLSRPDAGEIVAAHAAFRNFRGIRQILNQPTRPDEPDHLSHPAWLDAFAHLRRHGASFDLQVYHRQMPAAARLARRYKDVPIVLNHAGMPTDLSAEGLAAWRRDLAVLAQCDNVSAKISGIGMCVADLDDAKLRLIVEGVVAAFGVERVMLASNFPVDGLFSGFGELWRMFARVVATWSTTERARMFHDNAARVYRI